MIPAYTLISATGKTLALNPNNWPSITDNNATFEDEGISTTGWSTINASLSLNSGWLRQTKTAGGSNSSMSKALTFTPSNSDYLFYGKIRATYASGAQGVIWFLNGSKEVSLWLGSGNADTATLGSISICGTTGASTRNVAQVATGFNYETTAVEFLLAFDQKFTSLTCYFRESDGRFAYKARVACDWFSSSQVQLLTNTAASAGSWVEFDYLSLCNPNIVAIGDSVCAGATLFNPNRSLALTNYESTLWRHMVVYKSIRNNFVVNKGVGSQTSAQILSRITDATSLSARVIVLVASSNDESASVSQSTRTSNIQSSINAITGSGSVCVLFNGSYGTQSGADNTPPRDLRDYMLDWWDNYRPSLSGVHTSTNIMLPLLDSNGFLDTTKAQSDGIHFNVNGYTQAGYYASIV